MKLTPKDYLEEVNRGAPVYQPPLARKVQRVQARGRSGKPRRLSEEEIYRYKLKKLKELESF